MEKQEALFSQIVDDYINGKISKEKALEKLDKKNKSSKIDIKKELNQHFKIFAFHKYIKCEIDEYITICDKIENSPSAQEREDYENMIRIIINGVRADCIHSGNSEDDSDIMATLTVRKEVDKIRALCRKNREQTELYEKCKIEIDAFTETIHKQTMEQLPLAQNKYITEMIEEGILTKDGKTPVKNMNDVAEFLNDKGQKVTVTLLKDLGLQKSNGKPYKDRTYQYAVNLANTNSTLKEKQCTRTILIRQKRKKST